MAVWRATDGADMGWIALDAWSRRNASYNAQETRKRWEHYSTSPPTKIGAGTLFWIAEQASKETVEATEFFDPWHFPKAPLLPSDALPPVLKAFAEDRARVISADVGAIAWAALSACSTAIDGHIRLHMKRHDT